MSTLKIKEIRKERNISLEGLSKLSNISKSYLSELENERYEPTVLIACQLCKALRVSPNELINEELWKLS